MHDRWRGECFNRLIRPSIPHPRDQGDRHEHQARQRRSSGADDDVKVLPGGKRQHRSLLHDRSPFDVNANDRRLICLNEEVYEARLMDGIKEKHTRLVWLNCQWSECLICERQVSVPKIRPKIPACFVTTHRLAHRVCLHQRTIPLYHNTTEKAY